MLALCLKWTGLHLVWLICMFFAYIFFSPFWSQMWHLTLGKQLSALFAWLPLPYFIHAVTCWHHICDSYSRLPDCRFIFRRHVRSPVHGSRDNWVLPIILMHRMWWGKAASPPPVLSIMWPQSISAQHKTAHFLEILSGLRPGLFQTDSSLVPGGGIRIYFIHPQTFTTKRYKYKSVALPCWEQRH